jgi:hypothetical protein
MLLGAIAAAETADGGVLVVSPTRSVSLARTASTCGTLPP